MSTVADTDVLIVGAGPVGLFLANECARRGLRWRLIEKRAAQSEHSKALAIFPRTLEIFDMAGLAERFLEAANRVTAVAIETHGHRLATMHFEPRGTPYPFVAMVPQDVTERLLCEALRARGGHIEYCTSFVSAEPQEGGVLVRMSPLTWMARRYRAMMNSCSATASWSLRCCSQARSSVSFTARPANGGITGAERPLKAARKYHAPWI